MFVARSWKTTPRSASSPSANAMPGACWRSCVAFALAAAPGVAAQAPALEHFTVVVDGPPLALWARRPPSPVGTILLLHGRTWSALPDFDLQVPGESRSILANLAARHYAAY